MEEFGGDLAGESGLKTCSFERDGGGGWEGGGSIGG